MKIEFWNITQSPTEMLDDTVRTEVTFVTNDEIDRDTLLDHIKLYDKSTAPIDLCFYQRMKKFADEEDTLHDFYSGKNPKQIEEICNEIYDRIHERLEHYIRTPQVDWEYRKLSVGIEILRAYGRWWSPPTNKK